VNDLTPPPPLGHNKPPPFDPDQHAALAQTVGKFMDASNRVREAGPIQSEEAAQLLSDHIAGMRGLKKKVEETKKAEKAPHEEAGKAVLAAFTPLEERLDRAIKAMLAIAGEYLERKKAEAEAEKRRKEAEAEALRKAAEEAAATAAASGNLDAELQAERLAKDAAKAAKDSARSVNVGIASATGGGRTISTRKTREAEILSINKLFLRYREHPKLIEVLQGLANADVRSKDLNEANADIFGIRIVERERAA
jgi:23S rRNA pseudoU1915 N3-methylase RlmH